MTEMTNKQLGISKIAALIWVAAIIAAGVFLQWWFQNRYLPAKRGEIPSTSIFEKVRKNTSTTNKSSKNAKSNSTGGKSQSGVLCAGKLGVAAINCITDKAVIEKSTVTCENLVSKVDSDSKSARDYCITRVVSRTGNTASCLAIKNAQFKNECFVAAADVNKDANICKNIDVLEVREDCFLRVIRQTFDLRYCSQIQTRQRKDVCNALAHPYKKDPLSLCENRTTESSKNLCYREAAIARQDLSLCNKTTTDLDKYSCVTALAQMKNSREICDTITDQFFRNTCYDAIKTFRN